MINLCRQCVDFIGDLTGPIGLLLEQRLRPIPFTSVNVTFVKSVIGLISFLLTYSLKDFAFAIWSGEETMKTRVPMIAESYFRRLDRISVISDVLNPADMSLIQNLSTPCQVSFIHVNDSSEYLAGTRDLWAWTRPQGRFLPGMKHFYEANRGAKWYVFGDDDTYFMVDRLLDYLQPFNWTDDLVFGRWYLIFSEAQGFSEDNTFAQGGAGIVISAPLMQKVAPILINCSERYNWPYFASDMRLSVCLQKVANFQDVKIRAPFESSPPFEKVKSYATLPLTFHTMRKKEHFIIMKRATRIPVGEHEIDISRISFSEFTLESQTVRLGHSIYNNDDETTLPALDTFAPIFVNDTLSAIEQSYGPITLRLQCSLTTDLVDIEMSNSSHIIGSANCSTFAFINTTIVVSQSAASDHRTYQLVLAGLVIFFTVIMISCFFIVYQRLFSRPNPNDEIPLCRVEEDSLRELGDPKTDSLFEA